METLFDIVYLVTVITIGIRMIVTCKGNRQYRLFGIMAVVLGAGDAFHLVPRALALCTTGLENYTVALGAGKFITSITMTIFYVILYYVWRIRYEVKGRNAVTAAVYALAALRILLCLFPQNRWLSEDAPLSWGIYRNIPFALLGLLIIVSECKGASGQRVPAYVADNRAQLWLLHSGGALGGRHPRHWHAHDSQDLRLCLDGSHRIPGNGSL